MLTAQRKLRLRSRSGTPTRTPADQPVQFDALWPLTIYLLLLFFVPARWVLPGLGAAGRPAAVFAIGLFVLWMVAKLLPNFETRSTPLRWAVLVNAIVVVVTYGVGYDRGLPASEALSSDRAILTLIAQSGVLLTVSEGMPTADHVNELSKRVTYAATGAIVVGLIQFTTGFDPVSVIRFPLLVTNGELGELAPRGAGGGFIRARGTFLHPIEFAVVTAMAFPLAVHHALHERDRIIRFRRFVLVALLAGSSALAVSRSAVVAMGVAVLVIAWAWGWRARLRGAVLAIVGAIALRLLVPGLLGTILALFENFQNDPSITGRTDDYDIVFAYIRERPLLGRGIGTFIPDQYILLDNAYLVRLAETGIVGLATLLGLLATGAVLCMVTLRTYPGDRVRHLAAMFLAVIAIGFVSGGTFQLFFFPSATGTLLICLGSTGVIYRHRLGDPIDTVPMPRLLRAKYRSDSDYVAYWRRFALWIVKRPASAGSPNTTQPPARTQA